MNTRHLVCNICISFPSAPYLAAQSLDSSLLSQRNPSSSSSSPSTTSSQPASSSSTSTGPQNTSTATSTSTASSSSSAQAPTSATSSNSQGLGGLGANKPSSLPPFGAQGIQHAGAQNTGNIGDSTSATSQQQAHPEPPERYTILIKHCCLESIHL